MATASFAPTAVHPVHELWPSASHRVSSDFTSPQQRLSQTFPSTTSDATVSTAPAALPQQSHQYHSQSSQPVPHRVSHDAQPISPINSFRLPVEGDGHDLEAFQQQIDELLELLHAERSKSKVLNNQLARLTSSHSSVQAELAHLRQTQAPMLQDLQQLRSETEAAHASLASLEIQNLLLSEQCKAAEEAVINAQQEAKAAQQELALAQQHIAAAVARATAAAAETTALRDEIAGVSVISSGKVSNPGTPDDGRMTLRLQKAERALEQERMTVSQLRRQLADGAASAQQGETAMTQMQLVREELHRTRALLQQREEELSARMAAQSVAEEGVERMRSQLTNLMHGGQATAAEASALQGQLDALAKEHRSLSSELMRAKGGEEVLKLSLRAAEDKVRAAEAVSLDMQRQCEAAASTIGRLIEENSDLIWKINAQANAIAELRQMSSRKDAGIRALEKMLAQARNNSSNSLNTLARGASMSGPGMFLPSAVAAAASATTSSTGLDEHSGVHKQGEADTRVVRFSNAGPGGGSVFGGLSELEWKLVMLTEEVTALDAELQRARAQRVAAVVAPQQVMCEDDSAMHTTSDDIDAVSASAQELDANLAAAAAITATAGDAASISGTDVQGSEADPVAAVPASALKTSSSSLQLLLEQLRQQHPHDLEAQVQQLALQMTKLEEELETERQLLQGLGDGMGKASGASESCTASAVKGEADTAASDDNTHLPVSSTAADSGGDSSTHSHQPRHMSGLSSPEYADEQFAAPQQVDNMRRSELAHPGPPLRSAAAFEAGVGAEAGFILSHDDAAEAHQHHRQHQQHTQQQHSHNAPRSHSDIAQSAGSTQQQSNTGHAAGSAPGGTSSAAQQHSLGHNDDLELEQPVSSRVVGRKRRVGMWGWLTGVESR